MIRQGGRVVAVEPGGVIMGQLGQDEVNVRLTLSGFSLKVRMAVSGGERGASAP